MNKIIVFKQKKNIRKGIIALFSLFLLGVFLACDDINSIHQKYYDWGEDIYTGVVDSLKASAGYEKVRFDWEIGSDPRITKTVIFWNQRADSVIINVNRSQSGRIPMTYDLTNLKEGNYIFEFVTRDSEGHFSLPREIVVLVYGESYKQTLRNRGITSISKQVDGSMLINWDAISSRAIQYVTVKYTKNGGEQFIQVENDETQTVLQGLNTNDKIYVYTTYLPENALETLDSPEKEYILPKLEREINKTKFAITVMSGDNTSVNGVRDLSKIWDGSYSNPGILHTVENAAGFNFPHHFTFDMGVFADITRFRIWPRTDAGAFTGHSPRFFEIWGAREIKRNVDDATYWQTNDWKADWKLMGNHEIVRPSTDADRKTAWASGWEYNVSETIGRVRYIRLVVKSPNWQESNCVNIGEITLWGDDL